jgi:hypothetical protein
MVSGPGQTTNSRPSGRLLRVKGLARHVAELEALSTPRTLVDIVTVSREAVEVRLQLARSELELNSWRSTTCGAPTV